MPRLDEIRAPISLGLALARIDLLLASGDPEQSTLLGVQLIDRLMRCLDWRLLALQAWLYGVLGHDGCARELRAQAREPVGFMAPHALADLACALQAMATQVIAGTGTP